MVEIERKFLVVSDVFKSLSVSESIIAQGYLNAAPERTVRVRVKNGCGFLTIKGASSASGMTRLEWEQEIDYNDARQLLTLCEAGVIEKTRYEVPIGKHVVEVDVFVGMNAGLVLAEIELEDENEEVFLPSWLGVEVTNDVRYYNSYLSKNPFSTW